jgi:hypothetical protein
VCVCVCVCVYISYIYITYIHTYIHTCIHTYMHVCVCVCVCVFACLCVCVYTSTYIHTNTHIKCAATNIPPHHIFPPSLPISSSQIPPSRSHTHVDTRRASTVYMREKQTTDDEEPAECAPAECAPAECAPYGEGWCRWLGGGRLLAACPSLLYIVSRPSLSSSGLFIDATPAGTSYETPINSCLANLSSNVSYDRSTPRL